MPHVCGCGGVVRSTPVAQTLVLRRVLTGGISTDSGRRFFPVPSTDSLVFSEAVVLERCPGGMGGFVFGTLLGPEATGPGFPRLWLWCPGLVFLVSRLHRSCTGGFPLGGRVCGVCGTGLLFENYIVDASIFYKKQFPRI